MDGRHNHSDIEELARFTTEELQTCDQFLNDQLDVLKETRQELERQKEKWRVLKARLGRMERLYVELSLQMEATRCRCGCVDEEDRLDSIDVENLLEGFGVGGEDEHLDPLGVFREHGQVSNRGLELRQRDRIAPDHRMM